MMTKKKLNDKSPRRQWRSSLFSSKTETGARVSTLFLSVSRACCCPPPTPLPSSPRCQVVATRRPVTYTDPRKVASWSGVAGPLGNLDNDESAQGGQREERLAAGKTIRESDILRSYSPRLRRSESSQ